MTNLKEHLPNVKKIGYCFNFEGMILAYAKICIDTGPNFIELLINKPFCFIAKVSRKPITSGTSDVAFVTVTLFW